MALQPEPARESLIQEVGWMIWATVSQEAAEREREQRRGRTAAQDSKCELTGGWEFSKNTDS